MTEFLIIVGVVDLLVLLALFSVMRAGRAHDAQSEAQARAMWAGRERVRVSAPAAGAPAQANGVAGRKAFDSHGTVLGVAGTFFNDAGDGRPQWLEVQVRGMGATRAALVPADGLAISMTEVRAPAPRDHILRAPFVSPGPLMRESELSLCRHYGMSRRSAELFNRPPGQITALPSAPAQVSSVA